MFENIVLRRAPEHSSPFDPGLLAEALLFYQNVHIILDHGSLTSLIRSIGIEPLFTIIENGWGKATYFQNSLGTRTDTRGIQVHDFVAFQLSGSKKEGRFRGKQQAIDFIFQRTLGKSSATRRAAKKFLRLVPITTLERQFKESGGIIEMARLDLQDSNYVKRSLEVSFKKLIPDVALPPNWRFSIIILDKGFVVDTNLGFQQLNSLYHKTTPKEHSSISEAFLLTYLLEARADLCFAANYMAEYATNEISSDIMMMKFPEILSKRYRNADQIRLFQDIHLGDGRALREAINSNPENFTEFLKVLDKANKFKEWLKIAQPDSKLLSNYYKAATTQSWIEKLPAKGLRFVVATGAGFLLGPAIGLGISAGDSFIIDRFVKGWRPHHFIEGPLKQFIEK